jgi:hypothetical protein
VTILRLVTLVTLAVRIKNAEPAPSVSAHPRCIPTDSANNDGVIDALASHGQ